MRKFGIELEFFLPLSKEIVLSAILKRRCQTKVRKEEKKFGKNSWVLQKDYSCGSELVSPILSSFPKKDIQDICLVLKKEKAIADIYCGLHVHVGIEDFNFQQKKNLFYNYQKIEYFLDRYMIQNRTENNNGYCQTLQGKNLESAKDMEGIYEILEFERDFKLNLLSYDEIGTVEFRHHFGTLNPSLIEKWTNFCKAFVNLTKQEGEITEEFVKYFLGEPKFLL